MEELLPWPGYEEIKGPQGPVRLAELVPVIAGSSEDRQLAMWQQIRQYESSRPKLRPSYIEAAGKAEEALAGDQAIVAGLELGTLAEQIVAASQGEPEEEEETTAAEGRYGANHPESVDA